MIHIERRGGGDPVLLLHGIGGSADSFADQLGPFAADHTVLAWDAPGYARSADPDGPPGTAGYARAAADTVRACGPAHVVGVSWGGVIATRLAADHPGLVRSLVLADSTRGSGRTAGKQAAMRARPAELERLGPAGFAARRGPRLVSAQAPPELVQRVVTAMARSIRTPGYAYAAAAMAETDHTSLLGDLSVPVLVVVGERDEVTGVEESRAIAAAVPDARLEIIEGAGHLANQERPEEFNALVRDFWKDVP
jgi:pimeloyl-ACP methyl ester carboxylesterase